MSRGELTRFGDDVLSHSLAWLDVKTLISMKGVSKIFTYLSERVLFHTQAVYFNDFEKSADHQRVMEVLARSCPNLRRIDCFPWETCDQLSNLYEVQKTAIQQVLIKCPRLVSAGSPMLHFNSETLEELPPSHSLCLRELPLSLRSTSDLGSLLQKVPHLTRLRVSCSSGLTSDHLRAIAASCRQLKCVEFTGEVVLSAEMARLAPLTDIESLSFQEAFRGGRANELGGELHFARSLQNFSMSLRSIHLRFEIRQVVFLVLARSLPNLEDVDLSHLEWDTDLLQMMDKDRCPPADVLLPKLKNFYCFIRGVDLFADLLRDKLRSMRPTTNFYILAIPTE